MKKILFAATAVACLSSSMAFAKTEGNYAGLSVINTNVKAGDYKSDGFTESNKDAFGLKNDDQFSLSTSYKYAFNFGGFFVAPGVLFDYANTSSKANENINDVDGSNTYSINQKSNFDINYRLGLRVDLGYDITDDIAAYVHTGVASSFYNAKSTTDFSITDNSTGDVIGQSSDLESASGHSIDLTYGLGFKYSVLKNLDLNLEYEASKMKMDLGEGSNQAFKLQVVRLGASYKF